MPIFDDRCHRFDLNAPIFLSPASPPPTFNKFVRNTMSCNSQQGGMTSGYAKRTLFEVLMKEKVNEASLRKSVCQMGKARDSAFAAMKKCQAAHSLAVSNHEKVQSELKEKLIAVGVIREAWEKTNQSDLIRAASAGVSGAFSSGSELAAGSDAASAGVSGAFSSGSELAAGSDMTSAAVATSAGVSGAFSAAGSDRALLLGAPGGGMTSAALVAASSAGVSVTGVSTGITSAVSSAGADKCGGPNGSLELDDDDAEFEALLVQSLEETEAKLKSAGMSKQGRNAGCTSETSMANGSVCNSETTIKPLEIRMAKTSVMNMMKTLPIVVTPQRKRVNGSSSGTTIESSGASNSEAISMTNSSVVTPAEKKYTKRGRR